MLPRLRRQRNRRFLCYHDVDNIACQELLSGVWQLSWQAGAINRGVPPNSYIQHWENCVVDADDVDLQLENRTVTIALVDLLKRLAGGDINTINDAVRLYYDQRQDPPVKLTDDQVELALTTVTKIWLHISPDLSIDGSQPYQVALQKQLPAKTDPYSIEGHLSDDFCAKHLRRKAGIQVIWTDDITQHLTFHKEHRINVFRHSSMLLALKDDPNRDPFPEDFANETLRTLYLLFRPLEPRKHRGNIRHMEKYHDVDLELAMGDYAVFDLSRYPYWHEKLSVIQQTFDKKTPRRPLEWWFNRRDRVQWATFWTAFIVFILTLVFGLTSSVTGIMQVLIAYHSNN